MDTVFERPHPGLADSYRAMLGEFTQRGELVQRHLIELGRP